MKRLIFSLIVLIASTAAAVAQHDELPRQEVKGRECYVYTIKAGEGLFSIARQFDVTQAQLHEFNENLSTDIKAGDVIYIPVKRTFERAQPTQETKTHTVEAKQTLYGIAKMYNIPLDTLIHLNPWAMTGLRTGAVLILSNSADMDRAAATKQESQETASDDQIPATHTVAAKETVFAISKKYGISINELIEMNPQVKNGLQTGMVLRLTPGSAPQTPVAAQEKSAPTKPEGKPTAADNAETANAPDPGKKNILRGTNIAAKKIAYLLPFMTGAEADKTTEDFIEFYRGSLIALEEAKRYAVSAEVYTFDTYKSASAVDSIMTLPVMHEMDFIVGPAYSDQLTSVSNFAKKHKIANIVPFTRKVNDDCIHDHLVQFNPPQELLFEKILTDLYSKRHRQYVICRFANCDNKGDRFADELSKLLRQAEVSFNEITISDANTSTLEQLIGEDSTLLVLGSSAAEDVSPIVYQLHNMNKPKLQLWGFEEWNSLLKIYPNTYYYSLFSANPSPDYIQQYVKHFGSYTNTTGMRYDLLGYDLTLMMLLNTKSDRHGIAIDESQNGLYLQSQPRFSMIDGRLVNLDYHIFHWDGKRLICQ